MQRALAWFFGVDGGLIGPKIVRVVAGIHFKFLKMLIPGLLISVRK